MPFRTGAQNSPSPPNIKNHNRDVMVFCWSLDFFIVCCKHTRPVYVVSNTKLTYNVLMKFSLPLLKKKNEKEQEEDIFYLNSSEQKRTVDELIDESRLSQSYYFMLFFGSIIVVSGILTNNALITIAGMLVAPLLMPILAFALGIVTTNARLVLRSFIVLIVSAAITVSVGVLIPVLYTSFLEAEDPGSFIVFSELYFLIAVFSGMAAAFSWTKRKKMSSVLSGAAIAVTLLPPLAMVGVALARLDQQLVEENLFIFGYNLVTIMAGAALVFLLSGFGHKKEVQKEINKELDKDK